MTEPDTPIRVWGLVPAAGMSRRMRRTKQTLPFRDSTVVGVVTRAILDGGVDGVVVITRSGLRDSLDLPVDESVTVLVNDDPSSEMIDSVRLGLDHLSNKVHAPIGITTQDGVLVIPGDMPTVSSGACRAVIDLFRADPTRLVMATHSGRRGHPFLFPMALSGTACALSGGLNELARRHSELVVYAPVDDLGILRDLDTPEDYRNTR